MWSLQYLRAVAEGFWFFSLSEEAALTCWVVFMAEEQRYTVKADAQSSEDAA